LEALACSVIKGVGPRTATLLQKLNIYSVQDLLFHLPFRYQDRTHITPLNNLRVGDYAVIEAVVQSTQMSKGRKRASFLCYLRDNKGLLTLRFFYFNAQQQRNLAKTGTRVRCFGEVRWGGSGFEMVHPEYRIVADDSPTPVSEHLTPIYSTTDGLTQAALRKLIEQALVLLEKQPAMIAEYLPEKILQQFQLPDLLTAIRFAHQPPPDAPQEILIAAQHPMQQRLAFEELLAHQLSLLRLRLNFKKEFAPSFSGPEQFIKKFLQHLPFTLTSAQQRVVAELKQDLVKTQPMLRLVQGDVGSGKTVVAAMAALQAIESGYQAAVMAPTELLAEQHLQNFTRWLEPLGLRVAILTGHLSAKEREKNLQQIVTGEARLIIGTHALFQDTVTFAKLGLVIVDEQHRFGVHQRLSLREKGVQQGFVPHQLIMTATPIPRTLAMTAYADLDCSVIDELPPGRLPVVTVVISSQRRDEVLQRVREHCKTGKQVYWVCTLITESELLQCEAAEKTAALLTHALPELRVGLLHGRLLAKEKEKIMAAFKNQQIDLLVATTVIEVGVDVPNASLMVIENPERLGLAQLHQLRGRVGRGATQSHCVLLYQTPLSQQAKERLAIMRDSNDGFVIAQRDLEIRGPGEVLGTRQTGLLQFKIAELLRDKNLLPNVQQVAPILLRDYPQQVDLLLQRWLGRVEKYGKV
jgi:ATP-dependent DNA helicase RecG